MERVTLILVGFSSRPALEWTGFRLQISQSQALNQAWQNVTGLNNAAGAVAKAYVTFSFIFESTLTMKVIFFSSTLRVCTFESTQKA